MADVPKDLLQEIKRLEELFTVDTAKLKSITEHFIKELAKGGYIAIMKKSADIPQV
jgi:hexokinase